MFKMVQSNHRGSSATGKRRRIEGEQWGKTSVMRLKQNAKTNRGGRAEDRETERERRLKKCHSHVRSFAPTLLSLFFSLTHSTCCNGHVSNEQEQLPLTV